MARLVSVKSSPTLPGHPVNRYRTYGALSGGRWVWIGPQSDEDIQRHFNTLFGRRMVLNGDVYLQASEGDVNRFAQSMADHRRRKLPVDWETLPMDSYLHELAPVGVVARKSVYDQLWESGEYAGTLLADLEHHKGCGPAHGLVMPALDTHPLVWSYGKQRLATPHELFSAQGLDVYPGLSGQRGVSPLKGLVHSMSTQSANKLLGNTMHIPMYALWVFYVLANIMPADDMSVHAAPAELPADDDDDGGDAVDAQPAPLPS